MTDTGCPCDKKGYLLGIGNPLLDISANVGDDLLQKYDLKPDDAIMADEKHKPLYQELIDKHHAEFIAGGSVQNSLRVAQWVLKRPNICTYFGCVGNDKYADILRKKAEADGVNVLYQVTDEAPTGTCAVLITGTHRSLCANLAAAQKFTPDHLEQPDSKKSIESAKIIYASGFFVAVSPESIMQLAKHAHSRGNTFIMNVSAPFVSQFYKEPLQTLMPYVNVLFGNEMEINSFAKAFDIQETSLEKIGLKIATFPKQDDNRQRVVVITQGCNPVILIEGDKVTHIPVIPLSREQIVDTNGAGDAFTGGFLGQLVLGKNYKTCVQCGIYTASHIIQHSGCIFSGECEFKES